MEQSKQIYQFEGVRKVLRGPTVETFSGFLVQYLTTKPILAKFYKF